jgi:hypothetical protein
MTRTINISMAIASAAVFAGAVPATAMQFSPAPAVAYDPTPNLDRARQLQQQAEALFSEPKQWKKAARLLEQSAALREASDPELYTCLIYAGRIRSSVGDFAAGRVDLEKAASSALARGAIVEAAHAYIDAAHVAIVERNGPAAKDLVARAQLLAQSPMLSADQKSILNTRLKTS